MSLVGICWAVACWVPFAIIMEVRPYSVHANDVELIVLYTVLEGACT